MTDLLTENARLRAALDLIVNDYGINHTSKFARDVARAALETSPLVQAIVNDAIIKSMNDAANGDSHDRQ